MNSSPISNCRRSKSAILFSRNINYNINSLLQLRVGTHILDERNIPEVEMKQYRGTISKLIVRLCL